MTHKHPLRLDKLIEHLNTHAVTVEECEDLSPHRGMLALLLKQASEELVTLRDDLAALHQQGTDSQ